MSRNPNDLEEKLLTAIKNWALLRPQKTFAGFTVESFKAAVAVSLDLRQQIAAHDVERQALIARRDDADVLSRKALRRVIHSIIADADEGEDGELYASIGYMPRSARSVLQSVSRAKNAERAAEEPPPKEVITST